MLRRLALGAVAVVLVLGAVRWAALVGDSSNSEVLARVRAKALDLASANGEPAPRNVRLVATRERAAVAETSGAEVASNRAVYLVAMEGAFVGRRASRIQRGIPAPRGPVLVASFDARTLALVHWGISDRAPALAKLGRPIPLGASAA